MGEANRKKSRRLNQLHAFWTRTGQRVRLTKALLPLIGQVGGVALDVGGGRHALHDRAWRPKTRRIRIDLSPTHRPDVVADASLLPFRDGSVDAVVMIELLEHVANPPRVVDEVQRVLKPGGVLIGSVPFIAPIHGDPQDYFRYSERGIRIMLHGLATVDVRPLGNHLGAAWALLAARSRSLRLLNPLMRALGSRPDPQCPQGYVFVARR